MKNYECIGGSRDGSVVTLHTRVSPGEILPLCDEPSDAAEHYRLSNDGKLHFNHRGPVASADRLSPVLPELEGLMRQLASTLLKIDRLADAAESGLPPFTIGAWRLERR